MINETTLMVIPFDKHKITQMLMDIIPNKPNEQYIVYPGALVGENLITDDECCYFLMDKKHIHGDIQYVYDIPVCIKKKLSKGRYSISSSPEFYWPLAEKYFEMAQGKPVDLKTFMGSRYDYNSRIKSNMKNFIADIGPQIEAIKQETINEK